MNNNGILVVGLHLNVIKHIYKVTDVNYRFGWYVKIEIFPGILTTNNKKKSMIVQIVRIMILSCVVSKFKYHIYL